MYAPTEITVPVEAMLGESKHINFLRYRASFVSYLLMSFGGDYPRAHVGRVEDSSTHSFVNILEHKRDVNADYHGSVLE